MADASQLVALTTQIVIVCFADTSIIGPWFRIFIWQFVLLSVLLVGSSAESRPAGVLLLLLLTTNCLHYRVIPLVYRPNFVSPAIIQTENTVALLIPSGHKPAAVRWIHKTMSREETKRHAVTKPFRF